MKKIIKIGISAAAAMLVVGCGGGSSIHEVSKQSGTQSYLFFGEVSPTGLGSLTNVRVIKPDDPDSILIKDDNTTDVRYSVLSTALKYDSGNYSDLYVSTLSYVSGGKAYKVDMKKGDSAPKAVQNSSATDLSNASYTKINYLGSKEYLVAESGDKNVLITTDMGPGDAPLELGNKDFLTVSYPSYGEAIDGYILYNNDTGKVEKCTTDLSNCSELISAGSRDYEGDVDGTTYSVFDGDGKLIRMDKKDGSTVEISLGGKSILDAYGSTSFNGGTFFFISEDHELYGVDVISKSVKMLAKDDRIERIRAVTKNRVIFGSDTLLLAANRDGSSDKPIELVVNTTTSGYKYVTNGVGSQFFYVTYEVDTQKGETNFKACILDDANSDPECKDDAFWAGFVFKKSGKLDTKSSTPYELNALVRVDDTDAYGGGTLKAIDAAYPLEDGITMGKIANYNFQTFLTNSRYINEMVDSDGAIVVYGKDDTTFHVDAFYMNLLKENSLKLLTDNTTDLTETIHQGWDHCHGRHCMICHSFAGGKIYVDENGTSPAYGYRIKLEFENGDSILTQVSKGHGENFSTPLKNLTKGNFKVFVLDENGTVVNHSSWYNHRGVQAADCNYCHGRDVRLYDAPGTISIK